MSSEVNGQITLAGVEALAEPLSPVVGARRCRVSRPLAAPATMRGRFGSAWRVDLAAARKRMPPGAPPDATVVHWVVEAPWSSEVVHSYSLMCVHLRFTLQHAPVIHYLEGATHEVALIAIHPEADRAAMLAGPADMSSWLRPAVFSAQIIATDDVAAAGRIARAVDLICAGRLSPHPTHVRAWVELFGDNMMRRAVGSASNERDGV